MAQVCPFREECGKARSRRWKASLALVPRPIPIIKKRLIDDGPQGSETRALVPGGMLERQDDSRVQH